MSIKVQYGCGTAVPEPLLNLNNRKSHIKQITCNAVSEVMKSDIRQIALNNHLMKIFREIIWCDDLAVRPYTHNRCQYSRCRAIPFRSPAFFFEQADIEIPCRESEVFCNCFRSLAVKYMNRRHAVEVFR